MGHDVEAEATYRRAFALKPDDTGVLNNLALALKDAERFDEASELLQRSLALEPNNVKTLTYLALLRLDQPPGGGCRNGGAASAGAGR
jgi:Flp pilus assembly protein TadD